MDNKPQLPIFSVQTGQLDLRYKWVSKGGHKQIGIKRYEDRIIAIKYSNVRYLYRTAATDRETERRTERLTDN